MCALSLIACESQSAFVLPDHARRCSLSLEAIETHHQRCVPLPAAPSGCEQPSAPAQLSTGHQSASSPVWARQVIQSFESGSDPVPVVVNETIPYLSETGEENSALLADQVGSVTCNTLPSSAQPMQLTLPSCSFGDITERDHVVDNEPRHLVCETMNHGIASNNAFMDQAEGQMETSVQNQFPNTQLVPAANPFNHCHLFVLVPVSMTSQEQFQSALSEHRSEHSWRLAQMDTTITDREENAKVAKLRKLIDFLFPVLDVAATSDTPGMMFIPSCGDCDVRFHEAMSYRNSYLDFWGKPRDAELSAIEVNNHIMVPWQENWIRDCHPELVASQLHVGVKRRKAFRRYLHTRYVFPKVLMVLLMTGSLKENLVHDVLNTCQERPHRTGDVPELAVADASEQAMMSQANTGGVPEPGPNPKGPRGSINRREKQAARRENKNHLKRTRILGVCQQCEGTLSCPRACQLCCRTLCEICLSPCRTACNQCPEVDCFIPFECDPPDKCQICVRDSPGISVARCHQCFLFGCDWCQISDRTVCRVCPSNPKHVWPRSKPSGPVLPPNICLWIDVNKGRTPHPNCSGDWDLTQTPQHMVNYLA